MKNALSFDLEDWFCVSNLSSAINKEDWDKCELRVVQNTRSILTLLDDYNTRATFFVLGWIADRVPEAKIQAAKKYFDSRDLDNIVFLHPGASQPKKLWPPERFARTVEYLDNKGYSPVLLSPPNDKSIVESIKNNCRITLPVLSVRLSDIAAYLACGGAFIGLDSGIGHIAAALGKNVIILFGPQPPSIACPRGNGKIVKIIKGDFECSPCPKAACERDNACMKAIQVEDVIEAIDGIENV